MNMMIRSQDKKRVVSFVGMSVGIANDRGDKFVIYAYNNGRILLGEYSTEKKALKALEQICNHADNMFYSTVMPGQCGMITPPVFEMPQDSEV